MKIEAQRSLRVEEQRLLGVEERIQILKDHYSELVDEKLRAEILEKLERISLIPGINETKMKAIESWEEHMRSCDL